MTRSPRWVLIVSAWIAFAGLIPLLHAERPAGAAGQVEFSGDGGVSWQTVNLPHDWHPGALTVVDGIYRLSFEGATGGSNVSVLLWQVCMNAAISVNGQALGDGGSMTRPVTRNWYRPLLFQVPAGLLRKGANELRIHVRGEPAGFGFLGPVYLGADEVLRPWYEWRFFLKVTVPQLVTMLILAMGLPTALLWLRRREERTYLWHAISAVFATGFIVSLSWSQPPVPAVVWEWFGHNVVLWTMLAIIMLIHRYLGVVRPVLELRLWLAAACVAGILAIAGGLDSLTLHRLGSLVSDSMILCLGIYPSALMFRAYAARPDRPGFWLMLTGNLLLIVGLHDVLLLNHVIPPFEGFYIPYVASGPLIAFTGVLLERFLALLRDSENLNVTLAARVEEKSAELRRSYEEQKSLEQSALLAEERSRILIDMHDGLGGRLVSTLARLENTGGARSAVAESVREALADMRLIIYSLEPSAQGLRTALALMRDRLQGACEDSGLELRWRMEGLPESLELGPRSTLNLLRSVQEAIANVLKHAQATRLEVEAGLEPDGASLRILVQDNGRGFDPAAVREGKGLGNLQRRARQLGGSCSVEPASPGVRVSLRIPLGDPGTGSQDTFGTT